MSEPAAMPQRRSAVPEFASRHPVATVLGVTIVVTLVAQLIVLLNGWPVFPAKLLQLVMLFAGALLGTSRAEGRTGVRRLLEGLTRWRIGIGRYLLVLAAMPLATVLVTAATGTLDVREQGWLELAGLYLLYVAFGAVTANLWEETAWAGFVQSRLMQQHGLLIGSLLTAVPFFIIHLPLAFEVEGWPGTS